MMEQRQFFLRDILTVIFKHKRLLIAMPIAIFIAVFFLNNIWPPVFESEMKIRIMRGREVSQTDTTVTDRGQNLTMVQLGIEDINSEIQLLRSTEVLEEVVTTLGLHEDKRFPYTLGVFYGPYAFVSGIVKAGFNMLNLQGEPDPVHVAINELEEQLFTEPVRDSHVLSVRCRLGRAALLPDLLNTLYDVYERRHIEVFKNEESTGFFEEQLERADAQLRAAQDALQEFRSVNDISLTETEEELLLKQYSDASAILSGLNETARVVSEDNIDSTLVSAIANESESAVVREMQLRLLELILERNRIRQSLGPNHPEMKSNTEQVFAAQRDLIEAIATVKRVTEKRLESVQARLGELSKTKVALARLESEVALQKENYQYYSTKLEESKVVDALARASFSNVRLASVPTVPVEPVRPKKLLNLALAIVGGIVSALALAFLLDYLDHGLKTPEDVEYYTGLAPMASFFNEPGQTLDSREAERLAILLDAIDQESAKIIQVTSAVPNEGAPLVASALADAYSGDPEARALLIDFAGNTGRPTSANRGVTDVLIDDAPYSEVFPNDNLVIVGRGLHNFPSYLWGSEKMRALVARLREDFRYIVFNVDPVLASHDALKLGSLSDGVVLTIKADATRREVVTRAIDILKEPKITVFGAVLTERRQNIPAAVYRRI